MMKKHMETEKLEGKTMEKNKAKRKGTSTSSYGVSKREGHDSSNFYNRRLFESMPKESLTCNDKNNTTVQEDILLWADKINCQSSEEMSQIPDNSVALGFTSPFYNVGKEYDTDMTMEKYIEIMTGVGREMYRILLPGGRYLINIANLGRRPYIPLHSIFYKIHMDIGYLTTGEIIWQKAKGANGSCAWGSWKSAKAPVIRDVHEYILVFAKGAYSRIDTGISDITKKEFLEATLSIWRIQPESAKRIGHPAPFPVTLASRAIKLYTYKGDVVVDPFNGSGTTCVAAKTLKRHYVGYDISKEYCDLAEKRLAGVGQ